MARAARTTRRVFPRLVAISEGLRPEAMDRLRERKARVRRAVRVRPVTRAL
jgi:hypothetical protein